MDQAGALPEERLDFLPAGAGADLLMRTWALTLGLWQSLDCPEPIREHLERDPKHPLVAHLLRHDFTAELTDMVRQFWTGALLEAQARSPRSGEPAIRPRHSR